jgi:hypothetical protein
MPATEVIHRLIATADDKGPPGRDDQYGYGIVNLVKALTADVPPLTPSATPTAQATQALPPGSGGSGTPLIIGGFVIVAAIGVAAIAVGVIRSRTR